MNKLTTSAIVLSRINFGESDKIITAITPDNGNLKLMARGVRKIKSKLAGGIELFSVSSISFIKGRGDISTLVSTRLQTHFHNIATDVDRTMIGYDILKHLSSTTKESSDHDHYRLLLQALTYLNDKDIDSLLVKCWFMARLTQLEGHSPNIEKPAGKKSFELDKGYQYDYQESTFSENSKGDFDANHIKTLKLLMYESPQRIHIIKGVHETLPLLDKILTQQIRFTT